MCLCALNCEMDEKHCKMQINASLDIDVVRFFGVSGLCNMHKNDDDQTPRPKPLLVPK